MGRTRTLVGALGVAVILTACRALVGIQDLTIDDGGTDATPRDAAPGVDADAADAAADAAPQDSAAPDAPDSTLDGGADAESDAFEAGDAGEASVALDAAGDSLDAGDAGDAAGAGDAEAGATGGCDAGTTSCNGQCVDLSSDGENCGSCGRTCAQADAGYACTAGHCGDEVVQVASGYQGSCVVLHAGETWCWGGNQGGELGYMSTSADLLCHAGTFMCHPAPVKIPGLASVVEVAPSALQFRCARESDGSVWCWGANGNGQLGNGSAGLPTCPSGNACNVVPARVPLGALTAVQLRAAWWSMCARMSDGEVYCWGNDVTGVSGPAFPPQSFQATPTAIGLHGVTDLTLGGGDDVNETHACALVGAGDGGSGATVWCWGSNTRGQLGHAPGTLGDLTSSDGGPSCYQGGPCNPTPTEVTDGTGSPLTNVTRVAGGGRATCALRSDGSVWCWGSNDDGQLGANLPSDDVAHPVPVQVFTLGTTAAVLESGWPWAVALDTSGHAWTWGDNGEGQLGDGTLTGATCASGKPCQLAPEGIPALSGASLVSAHGNGMALVDGQILVWGFNDQAQLGHLPAVDAGDTLVCPRGLPCNPTPRGLPGLP